jgi:hypothetical protein
VDCLGSKSWPYHYVDTDGSTNEYQAVELYQPYIEACIKWCARCEFFKYQPVAQLAIIQWQS